MKLVWGIGVALLSGGAIAACANVIDADGDYKVAGSSSGGGSASSTGTAVGTGGAATSSASATNSAVSTGLPATSAASGTSSVATTGSTATTTGSSVATTGSSAATTASSVVSSASASSTSSASSSSSASSAASTGSGGIVTPPSWHLYQFNMATGVWSSGLLSNVWAGPNVPPSSGIIAACHLDHFDKLLVFSDAGMVYIKDKGTWITPMAQQKLFSLIDSSIKIADLHHVPSNWHLTPIPLPLLEGLTIQDDKTYWIYNLDANNVAAFVQQGGLPGPKATDDPPRDTHPIKWAFDVWNKSKIGLGDGGDGYVTWQSYGDGYVYKYAATDVWSRWFIDSSEPAVPWAGKPNAPVWSTITAAYFLGHPDDGIGTIVFIGP